MVNWTFGPSSPVTREYNKWSLATKKKVQCLEHVVGPHINMSQSQRERTSRLIDFSINISFGPGTSKLLRNINMLFEGNGDWTKNISIMPTVSNYIQTLWSQANITKRGLKILAGAWCCHAKDTEYLWGNNFQWWGWIMPSSLYSWTAQLFFYSVI